MGDDLAKAQILERLAAGEIQVTGRFVWGSNHTFLAEVRCQDVQLRAVYKPADGEQPLWDFPYGSLARREVAAYLLSDALGWGFVPPTVLRLDGPAGGGSLQLYLELDLDRHYFNFSDEQKQRLRPVALFDVVINNADRKGGHVILGPDEHIWLIDHGVCFHEQYKLRTVIWDFAGEPIPQPLSADLADLQARLAADTEIRRGLSGLLSEAELGALNARLAGLLQSGRFPAPGTTRPYPWPLV